MIVELLCMQDQLSIDNLISYIYDIQEKLNISTNCRNLKDLKDIKFILSARKSYNSEEKLKYEIVLKPEDYIIDGHKVKKNMELGEDFIDIFNDECQPAFMPIDVPAPRGPIFVFGEFFLRKYYTVFDRDQKVLGFSHANHDKTINISGLKTPYDDNIDINKSANELLKFIKRDGVEDINIVNP